MIKMKWKINDPERKAEMQNHQGLFEQQRANRLLSVKLDKTGYSQVLGYLEGLYLLCADRDKRSPEPKGGCP